MRATYEKLFTYGQYADTYGTTANKPDERHQANQSSSRSRSKSPRAKKLKGYRVENKLPTGDTNLELSLTTSQLALHLLYPLVYPRPEPCEKEIEFVKKKMAEKHYNSLKRQAYREKMVKKLRDEIRQKQEKAEAKNKSILLQKHTCAILKNSKIESKRSSRTVKFERLMRRSTEKQKSKQKS